MYMKVGIVRATQVFAWVALIALAGCKAGGTIQATGNEDQAKQAVQLTLDAWKSGTTLTDFSTAHPELVVADEDWQGGVYWPATNYWSQRCSVAATGDKKPSYS